MGQVASQDGHQFGQDTDAFLAPGFGDNPRDGRAKRSRQNSKFEHPMAALFHVLFKTLALIIYLFGGLFGQEFISTFVTIILLISMDFWVVKNVTGRLLAGLRWSNYIDDEGNSHWIFENKNAAANEASTRAASSGFHDESNELVEETTADTLIFWTGLFTAPTIWILLVFVSIFKLNVQWLMLVTLASVLSLSNLYGYVRCRLGTSDIKSSVTQFVAKQVFLNYFTSGGGGAGSGSSASSASNKPII